MISLQQTPPTKHSDWIIKLQKCIWKLYDGAWSDFKVFLLRQHVSLQQLRCQRYIQGWHRTPQTCTLLTAYSNDALLLPTLSACMAFSKNALACNVTRRFRGQPNDLQHKLPRLQKCPWTFKEAAQLGCRINTNQVYMYPLQLSCTGIILWILFYEV